MAFNMLTGTPGHTSVGYVNVSTIYEFEFLVLVRWPFLLIYFGGGGGVEWHKSSLFLHASLNAHQIVMDKSNDRKRKCKNLNPLKIMTIVYGLVWFILLMADLHKVRSLDKPAMVIKKNNERRTASYIRSFNFWSRNVVVVSILITMFPRWLSWTHP